MATKRLDWSMIRGDTFAFNIEIENLEVDLSSLTFTCRTYKDREILFQKTLGEGCAKIDDGKYQIRVAPEDTEDAQDGTYCIDLQAEWGTDRYTLLSGTLKILQDETY